MHTQPILPTLEIRASRVRQLGLLAMAIAFGVIATGFALFGPPGEPLGRLACAFSAIAIAVFTPMVVRKAVAARGRVLTLSAKGLRDFRLSTSVVPWEAIVEFGEQQTSGVRFLRVTITENAWAAIRMGRLTRLLCSRRARPYFLVNGQTTGLAFDDLADLIDWYHGVTVGRLSPSTPSPIALDRFETDVRVTA